jgi:hypothetical protein
MSRRAYWQAYYRANKHRWPKRHTPEQRAKYAQRDKVYRRLNRTAIKVAGILRIPLAEARARLNLPPWRRGANTSGTQKRSRSTRSPS